MLQSGGSSDQWTTISMSHELLPIALHICRPKGHQMPTAPTDNR